MSCIRSKDTRPEIQLGKMLWRAGVRYRKHYKIIGRPDFVVVAKRVAIFVDGDFWHGHNWKLRGLKDLNEELSAYKEFWVRKIRNNVKRDRTVNSTLRKDNWSLTMLNYHKLRIMRKQGEFDTPNPAKMPFNCAIMAILGLILPLCVLALVFGYCHLLVILAKGIN